MMRKPKVLTLSDKVGHIDALLAIERELRSLLDARLKPHGITYAQLAVLRYVRDPVDAYHCPLETQVCIGDVKSWFRYAPRTMTEAINLLESKSWLERRQNECDRRQTILAVTSGGSQLLDDTQLIIDQTHLDITRYMSRASHRALQGTLVSLRAGIGQSSSFDSRRMVRECLITPC